LERFMLIPPRDWLPPKSAGQRGHDWDFCGASYHFQIQSAIIIGSIKLLLILFGYE